MGIFTPASAPIQTVSATGLSKRNPAISNVSVGVSETTVTIVQPTGKFLIRLREGTRFELRTTSGSVEYLTVAAGCFYTEDLANLPSPLSLYVTSPNGPATLEIIEWERT